MAYLWQIAIIALEHKTLVSGVVLNEKANTGQKRTGSIKNAIEVLGSYFKKPLKEKSVQAYINKKEYKVTTNNKGAFKLEIPIQLIEAPTLQFLYHKETLKITQEYPVFFEYSKGSISVISDLDDTLIVSHTANAIKRIKTLTLVPPNEREYIKFTQLLIQKLKERKGSVYYISKSESNLFEFISRIFLNHDLPKGGFFLTPFIQFRELLNRKKGKNYKLSSIEYVLKNSGNKKFVLFGDDTQKDMEIYRIIAEKYPKRIAKIYIRQTKSYINKTKNKYWTQLKHTCENAIYYNKYTNIHEEWESLKNINY